MTKDEMTPVYEAIEQRFLSRFSVENGGPKKGSKAYEKQKVEFFTGAMSALHAVLSQEDNIAQDEINGYSMPAFWVLPLLSGRELKCEETK